MDLPEHYRRIESTVTSDGQLRLNIVERKLPDPKPGEVLIKVQATPINPSDVGVMFGFSNVAEAQTVTEGGDTSLIVPVPDAGMKAMRGRLDQSLPLGNEGAGLVVAVGENVPAEGLLGRTVSATSGTMYGEYSTAPAIMCLPLANGQSAESGASSFVNPMTALAMVEAMAQQGSTGLVHTAAASNLGQMLNRICIADGIPLINIVRSEEQVALLKDLGAAHVLNSSDPNFQRALADAIAETGVSLAFDAIGGGKMADAILTAMEMAQLRSADSYSIYGTTTHKQVYLYGGLDRSPAMLSRGYGMHWGVGGFLLPTFLASAGTEVAGRMRARVSKELTTTFASHYSDRFSMEEVLQADNAKSFASAKTGQKSLILPT